MMADVAEAGYEGIEGFAPQTAGDLVALAELAAQYGLHIVNVGGPTPLDRVRFNIALGNDAVEVPSQRRPGGSWDQPVFGTALSAAELQSAAAALHEVVGYCRAHHIVPFHHIHFGTVLETKADVDALLPLVAGLTILFDTGHLLASRSDPMATLEAHAGSIGHVHLKDLWAAEPDTWRMDLAAWQARRAEFTELGRGSFALDVAAIMSKLGEIGYNGWVSVEQDTARRPAAEAARMNRQYLSDLGY